MRKIVFALLLLCLPVGFARELYVKSANITLDVLDNGLLTVVEERSYNLDGCYSVIYREIPLYSESQITGFAGSSSEPFTGTTPAVPNAYEYDFNFAEPQCDKVVNVTMVYNMSFAVDAYSDASSLQFVFWGSGEPSAEKLKFTAYLPTQLLAYWLHNKEYFNTYSNTSSSVSFSASSVGEGHWFEIQMLFSPLSSTIYADVHSTAIVEAQEKLEESYTAWELVLTIFSVVGFLTPLLLFGYFYYRYSREEKVEYFAQYEQEPPTNDSPGVVSAILNSHYGAHPSLQAFTASIFDLARRGIISINGGKDDVVIRINAAKLEKVQSKADKIIIGFLSGYAEDKEVVWKNLEKKLKNYDEAKKFTDTLAKWDKEIRLNVKAEDYFNNKGAGYFILYSLMLIPVFAVITLIAPLSIPIPPIASYGLTAFIALVIALAVPGILGRWTSAGRLFSLKWNAFKKYLKDYSLISKHPPQSIVVWERYLVYAIVLGVADNVIKAMKVYVPDARKAGSASVFYYNPAFHSTMYSRFAASSAAVSSHGGGYGGGGGGFGGGHGGGGSGGR